MIINLKIVRVNSDYCDYLRKFDNKVAYNKNEKESQSSGFRPVLMKSTEVKNMFMKGTDI